jgi:hypothetical protein
MKMGLNCNEINLRELWSFDKNGNLQMVTDYLELDKLLLLVNTDYRKDFCIFLYTLFKLEKASD